MIQGKYDSQPFQKKIDKKEIILDELRQRGYRITSQRKLIIDIILENECSCCKEIYYQAIKKDPSIGIATIYRMIKTLEEIGAIDRKNLYRISCDDVCNVHDGCILVLKNEKQIKLTAEDFKEVLETVLKQKGYGENDKIDSIIVKGYDLAANA
jgi:Fur family ferric uptake transcriptional regulator